MPVNALQLFPTCADQFAKETQGRGGGVASTSTLSQQWRARATDFMHGAQGKDVLDEILSATVQSGWRLRHRRSSPSVPA